MSSGGQTREQKFAEYEKDYLERVHNQKEGQDTLEIKDEQDLQKVKDGQDLQNLIFSFSEDVKKPEVTKVTNVDYVGHCTFCMMGVPREEMTYKNGHLFHPNCFDQQGKNFPAPNQELLKQQSNAKVELIQLKNLKIRKIGDSNPSTKPKTKKKSKPKTKKRRPKRRVIKRKRSSTKRKKTKKRTSRRKTTRRRISRRRSSPKRKRTARKTKRRSSRRTKRRTRRRR